MSEKISLKSVYASYVTNRIKVHDQMRAEKESTLLALYQKYFDHFRVKKNLTENMWRAIDDGLTECVLIDELERPDIALFDTDLQALCQHGLTGKTNVSLETHIRAMLTDEFEILYKVEKSSDGGPQRRFMMVLTWRV